MKYMGLGLISSVVMLALIGAVIAAKLDGFNRWMFHSTLGGMLFLAGLAVWVVGSLCTVAGWFRRQ